MFGAKLGLLKFGLGSTSIVVPTIDKHIIVGIAIPAGSTLLLDFNNDMAYLDGVEITEFVDAGGYPMLDLAVQKISVANSGVSGTLTMREGWL